MAETAVAGSAFQRSLTGFKPGRAAVYDPAAGFVGACLQQPRNRSEAYGPRQTSSFPSKLDAAISWRPFQEASVTSCPNLEGETPKLVLPHGNHGSTGDDRLQGRRQLYPARGNPATIGPGIISSRD